MASDLLRRSNLNSATVERNLRNVKEANTRCPLSSLSVSVHVSRRHVRHKSVRPSVVVFSQIFTSLQTPNGIDETFQQASTQRPLSIFFGPIAKKKDDHIDLWLEETFSTSPLQPPYGIGQILTRSKYSTPSIFCGVFFFGRSKTKMEVLASDLLGRLRLLLSNCWMEFEETWHEQVYVTPFTSRADPSSIYAHDSAHSALVHGFRPFWVHCFPFRTNYCGPIRQQRWHIVLGCTVYDAYGLLIYLLVSIYRSNALLYDQTYVVNKTVHCPLFTSRNNYFQHSLPLGLSCIANHWTKMTALASDCFTHNQLL